MNRQKIIILAMVVLCLIGTKTLAVVEFKDGLTYNIDYEINDYVWVDFESPGVGTTVNVLKACKISNELLAYEDSIINMSGGAIGDDLFARDRSRVIVSGGAIGYGLYAKGSSNVTVSGGVIGNYLSASGNSQVTISNGLIGAWLDAYGSSNVTITGGSIGGALQVMHHSQVTISGGSIGSDLRVLDSGQIVISDGSIGGDLKVYGNAQVVLSGGSIGGELRVDDSGIIIISGYDFAVDDALFGYGGITSMLGGDWRNEPQRRLTGTLESGEPIDNTFLIGHQGRIVLVPEPATILLFGLSFLGLRITSEIKGTRIRNFDNL